MEQNSRYDRIDRVAGVNDGYKNFTVDVLVDDNEVELYTIQVMLIVTVNILAKWCKSVNINAPNANCKILKYSNQTLHEVLTSIASNSTLSSFTINEITESTNNILVIGKSKPDMYDNAVWADCSGWVAGFGKGDKKNRLERSIDDNNYLAASFAASLASAELFRIATGNSRGNIERWFSLLDLSVSDTPMLLQNNFAFPTKLDLGRIYQFGCGAVGSTLIYLLGLSEWKAELHGVDFDIVKEQNLSSSLLFSKDNAKNKDKKVDACYSFVDDTNIKFYSHDKDAKEFLSYQEGKKESADIFLCLANERKVWLDVQYSMPPLTYHATTTKSWGVNFGRHIPIKEWCLICRFKDEVNHVMVPTCSEGVIGNSDNGEEILGMLPFLPPIASVILLADIFKINSGLVSEFNYAEFSLRNQTNGIIKLPRVPDPCYVCRDFTEAVYPEKVKESKYWKIVTNA